MLVQWKTGRMGTWLLAREAEAVRDGAFIFAREFEPVPPGDPIVTNVQRNPRRWKTKDDEEGE